MTPVSDPAQTRKRGIPMSHPLTLEQARTIGRAPAKAVDMDLELADDVLAESDDDADLDLRVAIDRELDARAADDEAGIGRDDTPSLDLPTYGA